MGRYSSPNEKAPLGDFFTLALHELSTSSYLDCLKYIAIDPISQVKFVNFFCTIDTQLYRWFFRQHSRLNSQNAHL